MKNEQVGERDASWLSVYLCYAEPWEAFLSEAIYPFVNEAVADKLANQFFFIRYWEGGPHIRLRFKGDKDVLEYKLKPRLKTFFLEYFRKCPSTRLESMDPNYLVPTQSWYPNHSIQYIRYEPEIDRYGGAQGILIAEKQFELSSRTVLWLIEECPEWDYERAMGAAIQLHLSFAWALGMSLAETRWFFARVFRDWSRLALGSFDVVADLDLQHQEEVLSKTFEKSFEAQKTVLIPFHQELWNTFQQGARLEQEWLTLWIKETKAIGDLLEKCREAHQLVLPDWFKADLTNPVSKSRQISLPILESYIHMSNNRLGILNRDEAFLGYLMSRSLEYVAEVRDARGGLWIAS
jgi:thiopeptide-type bacteriocin biosynthesis protein